MYGPSKQDQYWADKSPYTQVSQGAESSSVKAKFTVPLMQSPKTCVEVQAQSTDMTARKIGIKSLTQRGRGDLAVEQKRLNDDINACKQFKGNSPEINAQVAKVQKKYEEQAIRIDNALKGRGK